jgi:predicted phosphoribosyltransferase
LFYTDFRQLSDDVVIARLARAAARGSGEADV